MFLAKDLKNELQIDVVCVCLVSVVNICSSALCVMNV